MNNIRTLLDALSRISNDRRAASLYNPQGTTYRGEKMPTLSPDPVDRAVPIDSLRGQHSPDDPHTSAEQSELKTLIDLVFADVKNPQHRAIFTLKYVEDLSNDEIAAELGISRKTVDHTLRQGLRIFYKIRRNEPLIQKLISHYFDRDRY